MTSRATPGLVAGCLGLVLAVVAIATGEVWVVGAAGVAALAAGLLTLGLADGLDRARRAADSAADRADRAEASSEAMAARAAVYEAEARQVQPPSEAPPRASTGPSLPRDELAAVTDEATGLLTSSYFSVCLDKRVAAARRGLRPLALAVLEPVRGLGDGAPVPALGRPVAEMIVDTLRDSDIACRIDAGLVAVIMEDTPENGAVWTVERIRRRLFDDDDGVTLRAGIACYPAHAFDADRLLAAAREALRAARDWHQDRIEVAALPDDLDV